MKKNSSIVIGIIVVIIIIVGGILIFHKSPKKTTTSTASTATVSNAIVTTKTDSSLGNYLATPANMALYTFGGDSSGVSNCTGSCLSAWPAYQDKGATTGLPSGFGTITRSDNGEIQYTYNGMPLYTFASDSTGQVTGNGVQNFSVAKPAASASSQSTTTTTTPTSTAPSGGASSSQVNY